MLKSPRFNEGDASYRTKDCSLIGECKRPSAAAHIGSRRFCFLIWCLSSCEPLWKWFWKRQDDAHADYCHSMAHQYEIIGGNEFLSSHYDSAISSWTEVESAKSMALTLYQSHIANQMWNGNEAWSASTIARAFHFHFAINILSSDIIISGTFPAAFMMLIAKMEISSSTLHKAISMSMKHLWACHKWDEHARRRYSDGIYMPFTVSIILIFDLFIIRDC